VDYQQSIAETVDVLRLIHEVLADLEDRRTGEAAEKLRAGLSGSMDNLPASVAEQTTNLLAAAYGALLGPDPDPQHAAGMLHDLLQLYSRQLR